MNELVNGIRASEHFREMLKVDPKLTGRDFARMVVEHFPEIDGAAVQLVRRWVGVSAQGGVSDSELDMGLVHFLHEARYLNL